MEPYSISAVIAVRNGEKYLLRALRSVIAQTCPPQEILVVDGESTDGSRQIAESIGGVRVITQTGRGIADAYNCGIASSTGDLVTFLSCDDEWTPDKLQVQSDHMKANARLLYTLTLAKSRPNSVAVDRIASVRPVCAGRIHDPAGKLTPPAVKPCSATSILNAAKR